MRSLLLLHAARVPLLWLFAPASGVEPGQLARRVAPLTWGPEPVFYHETIIGHFCDARECGKGPTWYQLTWRVHKMLSWSLSQPVTWPKLLEGGLKLGDKIDPFLFELKVVNMERLPTKSGKSFMRQFSCPQGMVCEQNIDEQQDAHTSCVWRTEEGVVHRTAPSDTMPNFWQDIERDAESDWQVVHRPVYVHPPQSQARRPPQPARTQLASPDKDKNKLDWSSGEGSSNGRTGQTQSDSDSDSTPGAPRAAATSAAKGVLSPEGGRERLRLGMPTRTPVPTEAPRPMQSFEVEDAAAQWARITEARAQAAARRQHDAYLNQLRFSRYNPRCF